MMSQKDLYSLRSGVRDGFTIIPKLVREISSLFRKRNYLSTNKYIDDLLKGDDNYRIESDFIAIGQDMRKVMKNYDIREKR